VCQADVLTPSLPGVGIPFALEDGQYVDILTTLARLVPAGYAPWDQVIDANYTLFSQGTTLLWLGSFQSLRTDVLVELHERQLHGCSVILVLVDKPDACQHLPALERFPVYFLGGKEQWHELLRSANAQPQISGAQGLDGLSLG
jgi:hypothetical protein